MEIGNMKNMVVLKNLPSNMIEEAFVILKPNMKQKEVKRVSLESNKKVAKDLCMAKGKDPKEYVIREAEMLVSDYIHTLERPKDSKSMQKIEKKYKRLKNITFLLGLLFTATIATNLLR